MAVALYLKLHTIATTLKSWKVESPVAQQLGKVESYFNKVISLGVQNNIGLANEIHYHNDCCNYL